MMLLSVDIQMCPLISKIKKALSGYAMIDPGDTVLVGVSGGPDSVALLCGLLELRDEMKIELAVAHLNHCARGAESESDARFVEELGKKLGISTYVEKVDVASEQSDSKDSFQEMARKIRLDFLQRTMNEVGGNKVALGHTSDDQAETVLMNLLRGSGLKGMGGMSPVRFPYIRPLFNCSRSDVIEYLKGNKISYCEDSSNNKTDYLRNQVRLELIPFLQDKYNPRILDNLFDASGIFRADNQCLEGFVDREFDHIISIAEDNALSFDLKSFATLPLAIKRRIIRKGIEILKGDLRTISLKHIEDILQLFDSSQYGKKIDLPDNLEALYQRDHVELRKIESRDTGVLISDEKEITGWTKPLKIPGDTLIEISNLTLNTEIIDANEAGFTMDQDNQAFLDFDKTGDNILIRFFKAGDRFQPLGMKGNKKLKSFFIDEKVPREDRSSIPILTTADNNIIWVYGTRISDSYRVTSDTSKILFIKGLH